MGSVLTLTVAPFLGFIACCFIGCTEGAFDISLREVSTRDVSERAELMLDTSVRAVLKGVLGVTGALVLLLLTDLGVFGVGFAGDFSFSFSLGFFGLSSLEVFTGLEKKKKLVYNILGLAIIPLKFTHIYI